MAKLKARKKVLVKASQAKTPLNRHITLSAPGNAYRRSHRAMGPLIPSSLQFTKPHLENNFLDGLHRKLFRSIAPIFDRDYVEIALGFSFPSLCPFTRNACRCLMEYRSANVFAISVGIWGFLKRNFRVWVSFRCQE